MHEKLAKNLVKTRQNKIQLPSHWKSNCTITSIFDSRKSIPNPNRPECQSKMSEEERRIRSQKRVLNAKLVQQRQFMDRFETLACAQNIYEAESRGIYLDGYLKEHNKLTMDLSLVLEDGTTLQEAEAEDVKFEDEIVKLKGRFLAIINKHRIVQANPQENNHSAPIFQLPPQQSRLPEFELPKFDGEIENFGPFRDLFTTMVSDKAISNVEKFMYLKNSCNGGKAEEFLNTYRLIGENYEVAWKDLCSRYDNKRLVADKHLSKLVNCKAANKQSADELRSLLNCFSIHMTQLKHSIDDTDALWNLLIVHLMTQRLDAETLKSWESGLETDELPTWEKLEKFLDKKCRVLENVSQNSETIQNTKPAVGIQKPSRATSLIVTEVHLKCRVCQMDHLTHKCELLLSQSKQQRRDEVKQKGLCFNCLRPNHRASNCQNSNTCKKCNKKHHTILHDSSSTDSSPKSNFSQSCSSEQVLLPTVLVNVEDSTGKLVQCRALLDSGSEFNLITEKTAQLLQLTKSRTNRELNGIHHSSVAVTSMVETTIQSKQSDYRSQMKFMVVPRIAIIPDQKIQCKFKQIPDNIQLADSLFGTPNPVDMIIGADTFFNVMLNGRKTIIPGQLFARESEFGWLLHGKIACNQQIDPFVEASLQGRQNV